MSFEEGKYEILGKLSSTEIFDHLDKFIPEAITFLETEMCSDHFSTVLQVLLRDSFKYCNLASLQSVLLQNILAVTKSIFIDCLEKITKTLESSIESTPTNSEPLNQYLKVMLDIEGGYLALLDGLLSLPSSVDADQFDSVPKILITVAGKAFAHCKESEANYGQFFGSCSSQLNSLFQKSFEIQSVLLKVLCDKFDFQCHLEDDLSLLLLVLEKVIEIGDIVCSFELTAIVDQWKGFINLTSKYKSDIGNNLNLTPAISSLTSNMHRILVNISSYQTENQGEGANWLSRHLKLGNFVLKVVIKLCELYGDYLSDESFKFLLQLLINMHREEQKLSGDEQLSSMYKSHITIGASPLLSHILPSKQFLAEFKNICQELQKAESGLRIGVFCLTINLLRNLIKASQDVQLLWFNNELISCVLQVIGYGSIEVKKAVAHEEESYSFVISSISLLCISLLDTSSFCSTESLLFSSFLSGNFFVRVFIGDLLCLLARLTNESVVLSWLDWFRNVVKPSIESLKYHPLKIHISILEGRLISFLSPRTLKAYTPPSASLHLLITSTITQPCLSNFTSLKEGLEGDLKESSDDLLLLWRYFSCTKLLPQESCQSDGKIQLDRKMLWRQLMSAVCKATMKHIQLIDNLELVFEAINSIIDESDIIVKLSMLSVVKSLCGPKVPRLSSGSSVPLTVTHILLKCLQDKDILLRQLSLELFSDLNKLELYSHTLKKILSTHSDILTLISSDSKLTESPPIFTPLLRDFVHKCSTSSPETQQFESLLSEEQPPPKKLKVSPHEINELIAKSKLTCNSIKKVIEVQTLSSRQILLLNDLISQYEQLKNILPNDKFD